MISYSVQSSFHFLTIGLLLIMSSCSLPHFVCSASSTKSSSKTSSITQNQAQVPYNFGYEEATNLWSYENYNCDDLDDYVDEVKDVIYLICDEMFEDFGSNAMIDSCKDGANQAIVEKQYEC
eukprot:76017_1